MIELEEIEDLSELKALLVEHGIDYDYPQVFRMIDKITDIINKKHAYLQEKYRLKEYALHCCEQANKKYLDELKAKQDLVNE